MPNIKIFRTSTVPISLNVLLFGQLKFFHQYFDITAISGDGDDLREVEKREGVKVEPIEMERKISLSKDFVSLIKLYLYFRKEKPQIVHSITPKAGLLSMVAAKLAGVPIRMHTFTGLIFPTQQGFFKKVLIVMDKVICICATNIYPEGKGVKNDLINYKITKKPLKILANGNVNGIDLDYFNSEKVSESEKTSLKRRLGIADEDFIFIFVGRLVNDKGINELVTAFKNLNLPKTKLLLVGPLEIKQDPLKKETIQEISANKNIITLGFRKEVIPYFSISHALVFPSHREGFPNVVMQAGAMGLPSIVTDISGSNEIIVEGENGTIIPPKNIWELQRVMKKFVDDKEYYQKLKEKSRCLILNRYEQQKVWEALLEEYQKLSKRI